MTVADAIAHILKAEGVELLFAYPINPIIEAAAKVGIRPVIVRQERTGLHMADAYSRMNAGRKVGVFCMQSGPGSENAFGGVAQAYGESSPIVVLPMGYARALTNVPPNFSSALNFRNITKSCEPLTVPEATPDVLRRAFTQVRNGRPRPVLVEVPGDLMAAEISEPLDYHPAPALKSAPDPLAVQNVADVLLAADRPVLYAGQGVHYARAWQALRDLAELLEAPVTTSLGGKSAFPETHPLSLGSGGRSVPRAVHSFLHASDVVFGVGCSFATSPFAVDIPGGKTVIHATLDPEDVNRNVVCSHALLGDGRLVLEALYHEINDRLDGKPRGRQRSVCREIASTRDAWLAEWAPKLASGEVPLSPYRIIRDLMKAVDVPNTVITHDAGSPRDQMSPFWESVSPLSYLGWGKTTQLGYGLGLAMGAKLARPRKLCVNVWGDAAIGFTGMDFETAVRERIPILSVLLNNASMAIEIPVMPVSTERYGATDISGNYAAFAQALGGHGERIETPDQIIPAIERGIRKTEEGTPALLEFITAKETEYSLY